VANGTPNQRVVESIQPLGAGNVIEQGHWHSARAHLHQDFLLFPPTFQKRYSSFVKSQVAKPRLET
jgi:hypothetical protein